MVCIIAIFILFFSHLTVDNSFTSDMKAMAWVVFLVIAFVYVLFGLIL